MDGPKYGDDILLYDGKGKSWLIRLVEDGVFHTHKGRILHNAIVDAGYGGMVKSDMGSIFYVLRPTIYDYIMKSPRPTQIVYPKDIGYIILKLGIRPGSKILEVGMGSGAITSALLEIVGENGVVDTYERRRDITWKTIKYLARASPKGLGNLNIHELDFRDASPPRKYYDAAVVDIDEPWAILEKVHQSLKPWGRIAVVVPTYNQLDKLEPEIKKYFTYLEAIEISIRELQFKSGRIRPEFRMIGFTAILITGAKIEAENK